MITDTQAPAPTNGATPPPEGDPATKANLVRALRDPRPHIDLDAAMHEVQAAMIAALVAANSPPTIFQRGRHLVRVVDSHTGGLAVPQLEVLTADSLRPLITAAAFCYKERKAGPVVTDPSRDQLAAVLAAPAWPFPILDSLSDVPVVRPDGSLHLTAGYDAVTRILYRPAAGLVVPPIPATPTPDQVTAARNLIVTDLFGDFVFKGPAERTNAVALLLLPFVRPLISGPTPLHLVESPTPGTGKSLLVYLALTPGLGTRLAADPDKSDEEATAKWITAKALAGSPACWIDNIRYGLDNSVLANALTSTRWSSRLLGGNDMLETDFRPIWAATGNNPVLTEELIRRTVRIRLDANTERPGQRDGWRHDPIRDWLAAQRGALIGAALTLVRAWYAAGCPAGTRKMGSFEAYMRVMGGILEVAGLSDFAANADELYETADPEGAQWALLVEAWAEKYGHQPVGVADLYTLATQVPSFDVEGPSLLKSEKSAKTKFGMALSKQRDKIYVGYKILLAGEVRRAKMWQLLPLKTSEPCEPVNLCEPFTTYADENNTKNAIYIEGSEGSQRFTGSHNQPATCPDCGGTNWFLDATTQTYACVDCAN